MIMATLNGDLIEYFLMGGHFNGIAHGCNCFCSMGAGIAPMIKAAFPESFQADLETVKGSKAKQGLMSVANVRQGQVFNLYTQYTPGRQSDLPQLYKNIEGAFKNLNAYVENKKLKEYRVGIPLIGCGIAGGDWNVVEKIINDVTPSVDIVLVKYVPMEPFK